MSDTDPAPGGTEAGPSFKRSELIQLNRSLALNHPVPDRIILAAQQFLANVLDEDYLHPPNNRPATARMRMAAAKLLPSLIDRQIKQQQAFTNLYKAAGDDDQVADSQPSQDADALREALAILRSENPGPAGDRGDVGGPPPA